MRRFQLELFTRRREIGWWALQLSVNDANAYTAAMLAGRGVGQTARSRRRRHREWRVGARAADWSRPPLPVYVVYPPNRHLSAKIRAFVDWAAELFAGYPDL